MDDKARRGAALIIGVGRYASTQIPALPFATADASAIAELLIDPAVCAFPAEAVRVLRDDEARRDNVVHHIAHWLPRQAAEADIVVLYFAGHGVMHRLGPREEAFLVPHDANLGDVVTSGVAMSDVGRWLEAADARSVVLLVDCCHAGSVVSRRDPVALPSRELGLRASSLHVVAGRGRFVLASCDDDQYSLEAPELGHGLFTHHLLAGIRGAGDRDGDGRVGITELFEHVAAAVERDSTARFRQLQKPWYSAVGTGGVYLAACRPARIAQRERDESAALDLSGMPAETVERPEADLSEGDLLARLGAIERNQDAGAIALVMRHLGSASTVSRAAAQRAFLAIGWSRAAEAIEGLIRLPDPAPMGSVLRGLAAIEATPQLVALLDRLADRLKGDQRNTAILLVERKRLSLSLETTQALFRDIRSPYRFQRALGQGLLTAAYLVQDEDSETEHVVRLLRPEFAQQPRLRGQFLEVSQRAKRLVHENLVLTREVRSFPDRGIYYALRDYVEGVTLRELLLAGRTFSPIQIVHLVRELLKALTPVHRQELCHGGIKPSNIFVCPGERILLGDLSCPLHVGAHALERLSYDFRYAPPEMMMGGEVRLGPAADFYALGCVAYELLCGAPPFVSDSHLELAVMHAKERVVPPRQRGHAITPDAEAFLLRLLARSPADRFTSLAEALSELDAVAGSLAASGRVGITVGLPSDISLQDAADRTRLSLADPAPQTPAVPSSSAARLKDRIGKYEILERIGRGGMGMVFKARDPVLQRIVVLKTISAEIEITDESRARFYREAQACARLSHPNIVTIYDIGEDEGRLYIVMEFLDGEELRQLIARKTPMAIEDKLSVMLQVCDGLHYAHQRGIVHRDIKPSNILVLRNGRVKILDFGIAQMATEEGGLTRTGIIIGTLRYIAPEQARGRTDHRSDMFSVGSVFYEFLSHRPPFTGDDPIGLLEQLRSTDPPALAGLDANIPPDLAAIIERAMRKDPDQRFADMGQMRAELERVQRHLDRSESPRTVDDVPLGLGRATASAEAPPVALPQSTEQTWHDAGTADSTGALRIDPSDEVARGSFDNAQFTVYRPRSVRPGPWYLLLAFAHLAERPADASPDEPDPLVEVERQGKQILGSAADEYQRIVQDCGQAVPAGGEVSLVPEIAGIEFNPPRRSFLWQESVHREDFRFRADPSLEGTNARGRLAVFLGPVLLAEVSLTIRVEGGHQASAGADALATDRARRFRRIFASYSHRDRSIVEAVGQYATALGDEFVRDLVHLRSGEVWSDRLRALIEDADVFQLFWSSSSMRSPFVRQEWEHALSLNRPGFVRPTYWEDPLPSAPAEGLPPAPLARLHFSRLDLSAARPITSRTSRVARGAPVELSTVERGVDRATHRHTDLVKPVGVDGKRSRQPNPTRSGQDLARASEGVHTRSSSTGPRIAWWLLFLVGLIALLLFGLLASRL